MCRFIGKIFSIYAYSIVASATIIILDLRCVSVVHVQKIIKKEKQRQFGPISIIQFAQ